MNGKRLLVCSAFRKKEANTGNPVTVCFVSGSCHSFINDIIMVNEPVIDNVTFNYIGFSLRRYSTYMWSWVTIEANLSFSLKSSIDLFLV